ncbi:MAG: hypothetical protein ACRDRO_16420 [Pseudonocardiaceae bacterium]
MHDRMIGICIAAEISASPRLLAVRNSPNLHLATKRVPASRHTDTNGNPQAVHQDNDSPATPRLRVLTESTLTTEYLSLVGFTERFSLISGPLLFTFGVQRRRSGNRFLRAIYAPRSSLRGAQSEPVADRAISRPPRVEGVMT